MGTLKVWQIFLPWSFKKLQTFNPAISFHTARLTNFASFPYSSLHIYKLKEIFRPAHLLQSAQLLIFENFPACTFIPSAQLFERLEYLLTCLLAYATIPAIHGGLSFLKAGLKFFHPAHLFHLHNYLRE